MAGDLPHSNMIAVWEAGNRIIGRVAECRGRAGDVNFGNDVAVY